MHQTKKTQIWIYARNRRILNEIAKKEGYVAANGQLLMSDVIKHLINKYQEMINNDTIQRHSTKN